jgi:DNA-binding transcriptional MerR regulator
MPEIRTKLPASLRKALAELNLDYKNEGVKLSLTLKELVKASEVSERTIRYYIQEGVLPPPQGSGQASRYNIEHLRRLSLVRRFKAALLPLSQIKQLFDELTAEELEQVANQFYNELTATNPVLDEKTMAGEQSPSLELTGASASTSAPKQTKRVEEPLQVFQPPQANQDQDSTWVLAETAAIEKEKNQEKQAGTNNADLITFTGQWNRISLAPGLEIHYEIGGQQDNKEGRERLAHLVELAMRLYR